MQFAPLLRATLLSDAVKRNASGHTFIAGRARASGVDMFAIAQVCLSPLLHARCLQTPLRSTLHHLSDHCVLSASM
jgi:hypothetical protein